jgi:hypothetical protein
VLEIRHLGGFLPVGMLHGKGPVVRVSGETGCADLQ